MKTSTFAILGNDFVDTTSFVEKLIIKTKAKNDQEHIKMNIIINNKLLAKNKEDLIKIIKKIEDIDSDYLILAFNNQKMYNFIKENTTLHVLNDKFDCNDDILITKILTLFYNSKEKA